MSLTHKVPDDIEIDSFDNLWNTQSLDEKQENLLRGIYGNE